VDKTERVRPLLCLFPSNKLEILFMSITKSVVREAFQSIETQSGLALFAGWLSSNSTLQNRNLSKNLVLLVQTCVSQTIGIVLAGANIIQQLYNEPRRRYEKAPYILADYMPSCMTEKKDQDSFEWSSNKPRRH